MSDGQAEIANASAYPLIRVVQQAMVSRPPPLGERDRLRKIFLAGLQFHDDGAVPQIACCCPTALLQTHSALFTCVPAGPPLCRHTL